VPHVQQKRNRDRVFERYWKGNEKLPADYKRIAERRGKYKARVALARKLLTRVFYAMRDGEVRCLSTPAAA